ncbi:MAG: hypothetical protein DCC67_04420 [Planctomycetota bacterium]|nr:MAG: hypothetical protein DCC67_04420 [Planctomycetota bacterium]
MKTFVNTRRSGVRRCLAGALLFAAPLLAAPSAPAADHVAGSLIRLNDNGGWSWFEDERAVVDARAGKILVSSVANAAGREGEARDGDVDVVAYDMASGEVTRFTLNRPRSDNRGWADDHNSAALWVRPDGRYVAMYSRHGGDRYSRWRVSDAAGEIGGWSPEQVLDNGASTTYSNLYYLAGLQASGGTLYNFTRSTNFNPNLLASRDFGQTWSYGGRLLTQGDGRQRPYVRYSSDSHRIHFITTEQHPRNFDNSIYHGYVEDGKLYNSVGAPADADLFDASAAAPRDLTCVFAAGVQFDGAPMRHAWTIDVEIDRRGQPYAVFQARANGRDEDHRFFYARFDGQKWRVHQLAKAGGYLYERENDYTGLAALDPDDPDRVVVSTKVDPRSEQPTARYELYQGITGDGGASWSWTPITSDSTVDNLRPVVPKWSDRRRALLWLRGHYATYTRYDLSVVGVIDGEQTASGRPEVQAARPAGVNVAGGDRPVP